MSVLNRRRFVLGMGALGAIRGQAPITESYATESYASEMPDMLLSYFARRLNAEALRWDTERAKIRTPVQIRARNQFVRDKIRQMVGAFPERSPLDARTTRTITRPGYRIENVMFQSRPDFWVTGNLYVPAGRPGPFPAVVMQRGHFDPERISSDYQQLHHDLVTSGLVVLSFDPIGQGERYQYLPPGTEAFDKLLSPTLEHCAISGLLSLLGESLAGYVLWDGIRAIDYLSQRSEIDRARIGCADYTDTGWSMLFLSALDERIQCAAIHAHGTARRWPVNPENWNQIDDPEQYLYPAAIYGVDLLDLFVALAPRPLLALVEDQSGDFESGAGHLHTRYAQMGVSGKLAVRTAEAGQDWPKNLRVETVRWFRRWLGGDAGRAEETEVTPVPYSALSATPQGSLREAQLGKPIYTIIRQRASGLPPAADSARLTAAIRRTLALAPISSDLGVREFRPEQLPGYRFGRIEFLSEPGVYVPGGLYRPDHPNGKAVIYTSADVTTFVPDVDEEIAPASRKKDSDAEEDTPAQFAQELAWRGYTVLVIDVRGMGETAPKSVRRTLRGPYEHLRNNDVALATLAQSLGESLVGMRVRDVLGAAEYAERFGAVWLSGTGMGAVWALYAAAVDRRVAGVAVQTPLAAYRMLVEHTRYMQATSQFPRGVLRSFDLPQVAAAIAPRPLTILDPADHLKNALTPEAAEPVYSPAREAYRRAGTANAFTLAFGKKLTDYLE